MNSAILIPGSETDLSDLLCALIRSQDGCAIPDVIGFAAAAEFCRKAKPEFVAVLLEEERVSQTFELLEQLRTAGCGRIVVVGPALDPKLILRALQAGADLFLDEADLERELAAALARILKTQPVVEVAKGTLTAILSTGGGCGASTIAVNLAALLAKRHGRCNLIDLNPGKSDIAPLLDLKPQYTLTDVCRNHDRLDRSMYEKMLIRDPGGIALLAGPRAFEDVSYVSARAVGHAIKLARDAFAEVVVDLRDCFHEEQMLVLQQATKILLVCRLDFSSIRNSRRMIDYLTARQIPAERIQLVINHVGLPSELLLAEAEAAIGMSIRFFIPHDPAVVLAANNSGIPAARMAPESHVVQSMARLVGLDDPASKDPGLMVRVKTWFRTNLLSRYKLASARIFSGSSDRYLKLAGGESS